MALTDIPAYWHRRLVGGLSEDSGSGSKSVNAYYYSEILEDGADAPYWGGFWLEQRRNFRSYATEFEKKFSILTGFGNALPVLSDQRDAEWWTALNEVIPGLRWDTSVAEYDIVGHIGWFRGDFIQVSRGKEGKLRTILQGKDPVLLAYNSPSNYYNYSSSEQLYLLVTDIYGRVLWSLGARSADIDTDTAVDHVPISIGVGAILGHGTGEKVLTLIIDLFI